MNNKCIMPECPYCPACPHGSVVPADFCECYSDLCEPGAVEWVCDLEEELIPLDSVVDNMLYHEDYLIQRAAEDYYLCHYATPEQRAEIEKNRKRSDTIGRIVGIGMVAFIVIFAVLGITGVIE